MTKRHGAYLFSADELRVMAECIKYYLENVSTEEIGGPENREVLEELEADVRMCSQGRL